MTTMGGFASKVVFGGDEGSLEDLNTNPLEDLIVPVETGTGATLPDYPTTGAAGMGLFPMQNTRLEPGVPTLVDTGVKFELPFMLVAHVVGKPEMALMRVLVHGDYISCDDKSPICVLMTLDAASEAVEVLTTDCVASLIILPVARPSLQRHSGL